MRFIIRDDEGNSVPFDADSDTFRDFIHLASLYIARKPGERFSLHVVCGSETILMERDMSRDELLALDAGEILAIAYELSCQGETCNVSTLEVI